jgi:hypothetical protein
VQYAITVLGKLLPAVFICLQERSGAFRSLISEEMKTFSKKFGNVFITVTMSGKLQKETYRQFLDNVIKPYVKKHKFMLIIDSWEGKTNLSLLR